MKKSRACPDNRFISDHSHCALENETFFQHITRSPKVDENEVRNCHIFIKNSQEIPHIMRERLRTPRKENP